MSTTTIVLESGFAEYLKGMKMYRISSEDRFHRKTIAYVSEHALKNLNRAKRDKELWEQYDQAKNN